MATTRPPLDPEILTSWEDAFQHPLPVVRRMEQQLRKNIDENRSKLRSLVGTSYRDLLGTAERIIEMDGQIQLAEQYMSDIGRGCNARAVERIADNHARMKRKGHQEQLQRRERSVAQTRVLQNCIAVVGRIVRGQGDPLLGAKVLVLARLVHKGLVVEGEERKAGDVLEDLRRKLGGMRKRFLGYVSRCLVRGNVDAASTVKALCAYSLISSSAPKDVLRHFMQVRFEQLESKAEAPSEGSLVEILDLYSQTLLDTKELFPRRFADALAQLSKSALIRDESVRSVYELGLDVYEQWIADDVRNFHPWVRHDQLSSSEVGGALASWTKQAQSCLLHALKDALATQSDAHAVLAIRQRVISKYLSLGPKLRNEEHARAVDDIRTTFMIKLEELADKAAKMSDLVIDARQSDLLVPKVWDLATEDLDLKGGAAYFRKAVMDRQHGRHTSSQSITESLDDWTSSLQSFAEAIATMRQHKWDDDLDLDLDDLIDSESLQMTLSKQDPQQLELRLHKATAASLQHAYSHVETLADSASDPALLIRIIRDVDQRRRALGDVLEKIDDESKASESFVASLHNQVVTKVSEVPLGKYKESRIQAVVALWDGSPTLPIQPSPATYRLIKDLHRQLSDVGDDLWSPDAVEVLKRVVGEKLGDQLSSLTIDEPSKGDLSNGHATKADEEKDEITPAEQPSYQDETRNRLVQVLFDLLYLQRIFTIGSSPDAKFEQVASELRERVGLEDAANERLSRSANEYWRRTYLLFGLLATAR